MSDDKTQIAIRSSAVSIGTELNQTYRIDSLIGVGGMGEVFKGFNIQTGDPVAIKIVLPEFARDEMILELFRKEARILNHLVHDAIVRYYVFSIDSSIGRPYLAMEYVDGLSLAERTRTSPLAADDFKYLLKRLADGLNKAHEAGVIHRDMSPDNVILPGGLVKNAKIIDFGIARSKEVGGATLLGGSFAGKYNYVSPEQLGLFGGDVTPKSDIYSLALVMAAALRGKPLDMSGSQVDVIEKRRTVPELTGVPKQFHPVLIAMLQPDPTARPENMAAVRDWMDKPAEFNSGKKNKQIKLNPEVATPPSSPHSNAMRNFAVIAGLLATIAIGALGGWLYVKSQTGSEKPTVVAQLPVTNTPPAEQPKEQPAEQTVPETKPTVAPPKVEQTAPPKIALDQAPKVDQQPPKQVEPIAKADTPPPAKIETPPSQSNQTKPEIDLSKIGLPEKQIAALTPPPQIKKQAPTVAEIQSFVDNYDRGNCLNIDVTSLSASSAQFNLLGTPDAETAFQNAFVSKAGFAPQLTLNAASEKQCGLVSSLRKMSNKKAKPVDFIVDSPEIFGSNPETGDVGDPLKLTVKNSENQNIYLFVMDHEGGIQNINRLCPTCLTMKIGEMKAALSLALPPAIDGQVRQKFYPTLVFAVASSKPLISINSQDAFDADAFIEPFLKEIETNNNVVSTKAAFVKLKSQ